MVESSCIPAPEPLAGGADALIEVLHGLQERQGHLSPTALAQVAQQLHLPLSRVYGVASFYHLFRLHPPTPHRIGICLGSACFVRGAMALARQLVQQLGVALADPCGDGHWSLMPLGCLGACGQAPVLLVDEALLTRLPMAPAAAAELQQRLRAAGLPERPLAERLPSLDSQAERPVAPLPAAAGAAGTCRQSPASLGDQAPATSGFLAAEIGAVPGLAGAALPPQSTTAAAASAPEQQ